MTELTVVNAFAAQIAFTAQMLLPSLTSKNGVWQHGCTEVNSGTSQLPSPANISVWSLHVLFCLAFLLPQKHSH